jgi:hypothetical protein
MSSQNDLTQPVSEGNLLLLLVPLMLVSFVYTLDQTIVATTLPTIGRDFHSL